MRFAGAVLTTCSLTLLAGCRAKAAHEETLARSAEESAAAAAATATALAGERPGPASEQGSAVARTGCIRSASGAAEPEGTDLGDNVVYYGFLRECADGRPAVVRLDLVDHYEGEQAVREAAKDGKTVEPDVDPVVYWRTPSPPRLRRLAVKPDATIITFDCEMNGCGTKAVSLAQLPWNDLYRFELQNGMIVHLELPYTP